MVLPNTWRSIPRGEARKVRFKLMHLVKIFKKLHRVGNLHGKKIIR